jgi:hypothetical protein
MNSFVDFSLKSDFLRVYELLLEKKIDKLKFFLLQKNLKTEIFLIND